MSERPHPLITSADTVTGHWQLDILWSVLVSQDETQGQFSVMEQLMPKRSGVAPHLHPRTSEMFYVLEGEMALQIEDQLVTAKPGQFVRIPPSTPHAFAVTTDTCRVLNLYVPALFDDYISMTSVEATATTVPPEGAQQPPTQDQMAAFNARLVELSVNRWLDMPDLVSDLRDEPHGLTSEGSPSKRGAEHRTTEAPGTQHGR